MIENNLLKTNFLGKDGFRWWIGQIAPEDVQGDQLNQIGNAWGCRLKVRIIGYHPADVQELADEDLPWAQVLLSPQGGSGKANRARSLRISPGDIRIDLARFAFPDPPCDESKTCAQGKSSSASSVVSAG